VVWINGVEYARIYKGPHQLAAEVSPTPDPSPVRGGGEPGAWATVDPRSGARALASTVPGWDGQIAPRLRRLRSRATALIPPGAKDHR
jgi:hypothetical protein